MECKKRTPSLRFKGFTDDWEQRKLGEMLTLLKDGTHGTHKNVDNGFYLLSAKNIKNGKIFIDEQDRKISEEDFLHIHKNFRLQKNDVLLTIVGTIGEAAIIENTEKITFQRSVAYLRPNSEINANFLYSLIGTSKFQEQLRDRQVVSAQAGIYLGVLAEIPIIFPPLAEQQKIGAFFKQLDETIALHQRELEKYKNLKVSYLDKMFPKENSLYPELRFPEFTDPWEQRKLGDITHSYSGGTPSVGKKDYYNGTIPFIRSGEINSNQTELFISENGLKHSSAKLVYKGNILYALYGATSGEVARSQLDGAINQAILAIIPDFNNDPEFIAQWLRKNKSQIIETYLQGGQGNLSAQIVKNLIVSIPKNIQEQQKIGAFFKQLDETIALHQRELEKYQKIKQSYLEKMFV